MRMTIMSSILFGADFSRLKITPDGGHETSATRSCTHRVAMWKHTACPPFCFIFSDVKAVAHLSSPPSLYTKAKAGVGVSGV
jgi:hypothetical protein